LTKRDGAPGGLRALPVWALNAVITLNIQKRRNIALIKPERGRTAADTINSSAPGRTIARIMIIISE
jgi:hypothetical protein